MTEKEMLRIPWTVTDHTGAVSVDGSDGCTVLFSEGDGYYDDMVELTPDALRVLVRIVNAHHRMRETLNDIAQWPDQRLGVDPMDTPAATAMRGLARLALKATEGGE